MNLKINQINSAKYILLFLVLFNFFKIKCDTIIHIDPVDIRKTSIRGGAFQCTVFGSGMYIVINQYLNPKTMLYYNWYLFMDYSKKNATSNTFDSDKSPKYFHIRSFGFERHIYEKEIPDIVIVNKFPNSILNIDENSIEVPASVRRALVFNGGLLVMSGRQTYYREGEYNNQNHTLIKVSNKSKIDITDNNNNSYSDEIYTRTSVTSLEFGLKLKSIKAVGVKPDYEWKRWADNYNEYYLSFALPIHSSYDEKVYLQNKPNEAYKIPNFKKPIPGIRIGLNFRGCVRPGLDIGAEASFLPSVINGSELFLIGRLGFNLNFGKLKYIKEAIN